MNPFIPYHKHSSARKICGENSKNQRTVFINVLYPQQVNKTIFPVLSEVCSNSVKILSHVCVGFRLRERVNLKKSSVSIDSSDHLVNNKLIGQLKLQTI